MKKDCLWRLRRLNFAIKNERPDPYEVNSITETVRVIEGMPHLTCLRLPNSGCAGTSDTFVKSLFTLPALEELIFDRADALTEGHLL